MRKRPRDVLSESQLRQKLMQLQKAERKKLEEQLKSFQIELFPELVEVLMMPDHFMLKGHYSSSMLYFKYHPELGHVGVTWSSLSALDKIKYKVRAMENEKPIKRLNPVFKRMWKSNIRDSAWLAHFLRNWHEYRHLTKDAERYEWLFEQCQKNFWKCPKFCQHPVFPMKKLLEFHKFSRPFVQRGATAADTLSEYIHWRTWEYEPTKMIRWMLQVQTHLQSHLLPEIANMVQDFLQPAPPAPPANTESDHVPSKNRKRKKPAPANAN